MPGLLNYVVLLTSFFCYVVQSGALSLPTFSRSIRSYQTLNSEYISNACTTNITIPTLPEECMSSCKLFQETQFRCQDYSNCMCQSAPSPSLQACMACIIDGIGDFAHSVPEFVDKTRAAVAHYAATCDSVPQVALSTNSTRATEERTIGEDICSPPQFAVASFMVNPAPPLSPHLSTTSFNMLFIFFTLVTSFFLLIITYLYPRLWKPLGLL